MIRNLTPIQVGLLGSRSMVGECILSTAYHDALPWHIKAFSRRASAEQTSSPEPLASSAHHHSTPDVTWHALPHQPLTEPIANWLCVAPIWVLPDYFTWLKVSGAQRIVALSSTSCFTKVTSQDIAEQQVVARLREGEAQLQQWAEQQGIEWVILRPTLIYGMGHDKNICEIARMIRRFGFFPVLGAAQGLRQPIHAMDVARACMAALQATPIKNRAYNIAGGETLPYRAMIQRVFAALHRPVRTLTVPLWLFRCAVGLMRVMPRYRQWSSAMAERMNQDMVFDTTEALRDLGDFGFAPRPFVLHTTDLPPIV